MFRRWWPLAGVAALLAAAGMAASITSFGLSKVEPPVSNDTNGPGAALPEPTQVSVAPREPAADVLLPQGIRWVLMGIAAVLVVLVALLIARKLAGAEPRFKRRRLPARETRAAPREVAAEVVAAVEAGLLELDEHDMDPRRAVIACWVRLERAAAAAGTPREPGDTSTDLVLRLLGAHRLSGDLLGDFADIYRRARYASRHHVDEAMRQQARGALTRLRGELTAEVSA